ncbi:phage holin family protein [Agrococcus sp. SL85]|uniref:phage holin family protein n=1 Tax=Agrococcus sp. SL85 TaxID=2995141 RepID=UPI00226D061B|nr:phage holin family protein [Agrococcus sp. SL85]WAC67103.1 phage holin family protein [Agrococcus sp. SL85]
MPQRKSLGELLAETPTLIVDLIKSEVEHLKAEVASKAKGYGIGAGLLGAAGFFAIFLFAWLLHAGFEGLNEVFAPWLSALLVAAFLLLLVGILALAGLASINRSKGGLETIDSIKDDVNMVKGLGHAADGTDPLDDLPSRNGGAR